jgi:hypothetical protein
MSILLDELKNISSAGWGKYQEFERGRLKEVFFKPHPDTLS